MTKQRIELGKAAIRPRKPVVAGSYTTITHTYTAEHPVDDTGCVKIVFRYAGDFGSPQFDDPAAPNYCSVHTDGDCRIDPRWDVKGHTRPWGRSLYLKVMSGYLDRGERITVVLGDTSGGSPGWRVQTFCEHTFEFKTLVDPIATFEFKELAQSPTLRIIPGKPDRAVCIVPSQVMVDSPFSYRIKIEDKWGNPIGKPATRRHKGFAGPGSLTISTKDEKTGLRAKSNPIEVMSEQRDLNHYWADLHGQSEETIGSNSVNDYFSFARDRAFVDIACHQGNDFQITDEFWRQLNSTTKDFNERGRFVTFPGYEWSANTPLGGDRNIYFDREGGRIVHSCTDLLPNKDTSFDVAQTATTLFRKLRKQSVPSFALAHVGGRYADMRMHDARIEVAAEIHSAWGTFEWLIEDALARGYRIGICANSDGHKGRPGASYPGDNKFGSLGGLTCVLARKLDRKHVLDALRKRHFFATTGHRPTVDLQICSGERTAMMGDVVTMGKTVPMLTVTVTGTAPIESVEVRNGLKTVETLRPYCRKDLGDRIKVVWSGAEVRGRARLVSWDGSLRVKGNRLEKVVPINFLNPDNPMARTGKNSLEWRSITTGGVAGAILTLERPDIGTLYMRTAQKTLTCSVKSIGMKPQTWSCGGLRKQIQIYRLPDRQRSNTFSFELPLAKLHKGDNPIYIKVVQEDGHMAWTSPVYVAKRDEATPQARCLWYGGM